VLTQPEVLVRDELLVRDLEGIDATVLPVAAAHAARPHHPAAFLSKRTFLRDRDRVVDLCLSPGANLVPEQSVSIRDDDALVVEQADRGLDVARVNLLHQRGCPYGPSSGTGEWLEPGLLMNTGSPLDRDLGIISNTEHACGNSYEPGLFFGARSDR
jgi:hypothetical protein